MISLRDDFAEPDFEEMAVHLAEASGIPWTAHDAEMWSQVFKALKPPADPDETEG